MKRTVFFLFALWFIIPQSVFAWGKTGHRIVGEIAQRHLTKKAQKNIERVLGSEDLAMASNWMDFIKSDRNYRFMYTWHFVSIPDGKRYEDITPPASGDVIGTIERLTEELKTGEYTHEDERFVIRCLIHLIGDIHQPLHVGRAEDAGGNRVKLGWFRSKSNLHRVWDSELIDHQQLSYTEYATYLDHAPKDTIKVWQDATVRDWAYESMEYRKLTYDLPPDSTLRFRYNFDHKAVLEKRLNQAGIRLAGILNMVYGKSKIAWKKELAMKP
ncbi:MAG: S1/P1 nuclease [Bacteroidia bacterium]